MNIPLYRAKKIDSDELVEGYLVYYKSENKYYIKDFETQELFHWIDPSTLAIHFPNMIDKNGKKIFASLSEDGVGGDTLKGNILAFTARLTDVNRVTWQLFEVIGIHKGE